MTRGGKREGSGRKPHTEELKKRGYKTTDEEHEIIKRWLKKRHKKREP